MASPRAFANARGFSLVELLVAMAFTMVLMAGMATVFKASLSSFFTNGEVVASARRNRLSLDLMGEDLNAAEMFLTDLTVPPTVLPATPPFFILPNMPIVGLSATPAATDPTTTSELYFLMDMPLAFEGKLVGPPSQQTASELVVAGVPAAVADNTFSVECTSATYANQVKQGMVFLFKDSWETAYITSAPTYAGSQVTVIAGADPNSALTGTGLAGMPLKAKHLPNTGVVFIQQAQMVRYRIQILQLDPANANGVPCLVRDQGVYVGAGFAPTGTQQIITENVSGFKVYLSVDSGVTWAGLTTTATGFADGWDGGIRTDLDNTLATKGRPGYTSTRGGEYWFRDIPTLVRVDVTTRTTTARTDYAKATTTANTAIFRELTQSLVFVPRHSGLTMK